MGVGNTGSKERKKSSVVYEYTSPGAQGQAEPWAWITRVAFFLAIALVGARLTLGEMLREVVEVNPGSFAAPRTPGPATSLFLDLLCCVPGLLVLLRRVVDRDYVLRWNWSHILAGALGVWTLLSTGWAADQFAAMVAGCQFLSAVALIWSMTQLVRSWLRLKLLAAACAGLLAVLVVHGYERRLVDFREQVREWNDPSGENSRESYLKQNHLSKEDFAFRQFEKKLLSGELMGFFHSPNTYAAVLVLLGVVCAGAAVQRFWQGDAPGWGVGLAMIVGAMFFPLRFTYSKTGFGTAIVAGVMLAGIGLFGRVVLGKAKRAYWVAVAAFVVGVAAVAGHGMAHGNLMDQSLTVRWYYWTGAARIAAHRPVLGIGAENFGYYYPQVRRPEATEEPKDPHNFLIKAFVELGVVGGVLMMAWMLRLWWELTRPIVPGNGAANSSGRGRAVVAIAILSAVAAVMELVLGTDFSAQGAWVVLQALAALAGGGLFFLGFSLAALRGMRDERLDERPCPWVLWAMLVGMGLFLAHNLIDFSLWEPGPMFLLALLLGGALGVRQPSAAGLRKKTGVAIGMFCGACALWVGFAIFAWGRTASAEMSAAQGDELYRTSVVQGQGNWNRAAQAAMDFRDAFATQGLNADYAYREARVLMAMGAPALRVEGAINAAIEANPRVVQYYRLKAEYELGLKEERGESIRQAYQRALELDPHNVGTRLDYAAALAKLGDREGAAEQFREALRQDARLPEGEVKRMRPDQRAGIEAKIRELGGK